MNIQNLVTFHKVAKERSFSKAAKKMHFVQSNITAKIKKLENEYQTQLFFRNQNGVTLTPAGERLLTYSEKIINLVNESKKEIIPKDYLLNGKLVIGSMETTAAVRLPMILSQYHIRYPQVEIMVQTNNTDELITKIQRKEVEGAFIAGKVNIPTLEQIPVFFEELFLLFNSQFLLKNKKEDLIKQTIIMFKVGCYYRRILEGWLESEGNITNRIMELSTLDGIVGCVKGGLGVSVLTKSVIEQIDTHQELSVIPLPDQYRFVTTFFTYPKNTLKSPAFLKFIKFLHELKK
ncbi:MULTISPECIES: LysR family transcriptional regulator [unclassified Bacillus cereus group]|uniref:LysR family transcriptional regulator n=1 Tax=unclassified Bacillus cereus group TaxID=2750818 RepID=UPI001F5A63DD|nr:MULTISPECIES: LysR family transcriptional regulator [unclassified Bacillus cereus group]